MLAYILEKRKLEYRAEKQPRGFGTIKEFDGGVDILS